MKKIKSLIPILSISCTSLLAPTLVSCGQRVELIGGSTQLNTIYGDEGCDSTPWVCKCDGEKVMPSRWDIEFLSAQPTSGQITVENGLVKWGDLKQVHLAEGTYTFLISATYKSKTYTSKQITLMVTKSTKDTVTGGKYELVMECDKAGADVYAWSAKNADGSIVENPEFSLESSHLDEGININSSGYIHWSESVQPASYVFKVKAVANGKTYYSDDIKYTFTETPGDITIEGGSTQLTGNVGVKRKDDKQWKIFFGGQEVQASNYVIVSSESKNVPTNITITNDGYVCWDEFLGEGTYTFKVKATYKSKTVISKLITLEMKVPKEWGLYNGSETLNGEQAYEGQDSNKWVAKLDGEDVPATLSIVNVQGKTEGITIEDGHVKWPKALTPGEYKFKVHAEYLEQIPIESNVITLTIVKTELTVKSGRTNYGYSASAQGKVDQAWKTFIKSEEVSSKFTLVPSETNQAVPSWLLIDKDGYICWTDDIEYGTYKFKIKAVYNEACEAFSDEITLNMVEPSDQNLFEWNLFGTTASLTSIKEPTANVVVPSNYVDDGGKVYVVNEVNANFSGGAGTTALKSIFIPDCVQKIVSNAFSGCSELTSITLPYYQANDCNYLCSGCSKLETIVIPDGWTSIPLRCFQGCTKLKNLTLSKNLTYISIEAFENCDALVEVDLGPEIEFIGDDAFSSCNALSTVYIGSKLKQIGDGSLKWCYNLEAIYYDGLKQDFKNVIVGFGWHRDSGTSVLGGAYIHFSDGTTDSIGNY